MFTFRISFSFLFWGSRNCDSRGGKTNRQLLSHHRLGEDTEITAHGGQERLLERRGERQLGDQEGLQHRPRSADWLPHPECPSVAQFTLYLLQEGHGLFH